MSSPEPPEFDINNPNTQQVLPGVAFKWMEDRRIIICRLQNNRRDAVDIFNLAFGGIIRDRQRDRPFLVLFDLSKLDLGPDGIFP